MKQNLEQKFAQLKIGGKTYQLEIKDASIGHGVIDVSNLYHDSGYCTFDLGSMSTASCTSSITYIDGMNGVLRYRGYNIDQLSANSHFLETAHLLLYGDLPTKLELAKFENKITYHSLVNEQIRNLFMAFRHSAHPMAIMIGAVSCLAAFYNDSCHVNDEFERDEAAMMIIAKIPTIAALAYKYSIGQPFMYPQNDLGFIDNFLYMMFGTPCGSYHVNPVISHALDKIFILHADHEQNASTSTVRNVGSSGANLFACISAGIGSLWGPAHGGANEAVIKMLKEIKTLDRIPEYIKRAKDKNDPFRLMGFGHRVYKNYDPRAAVLKDICKKVLDELNKHDHPLLKIALELEKIALSDEYFIQRKLYPNVDFYSGIIYEAIGIPSQMFTVLFAVARTVGWVSQWREMMNEKQNKIYRPRQLYQGYVERNFVDLEKR